MAKIHSLGFAALLLGALLSKAFAAPLEQSGETALSQTGFAVTNEAIRAYFESGGGSRTFGFPISNEFLLLGYPTQIFQRHVLQVGEDGGVHPLNLLDPEILPISSFNFSTFPDHDEIVATSAPGPGVPNYGQAVIAHIDAVVPDVWEGKRVNFRATYLAAAGSGATGARAALDALEVWGFPTSQPAQDPDNDAFVFQRFQRGVLHFDAANGSTGGILLGEAFALVLAGNPEPEDLAAQAAGTRFWAQLAPDSAVARAAELPVTDLRSAFGASSPSAIGVADNAAVTTPSVAPAGAAALPSPIPTSPAAQPTSGGVVPTATPIVVVITLPGGGSSETATPAAVPSAVPPATVVPTAMATATAFPTSTPTRPPATATRPPATPTVPPAPGQAIQSGETKSGSLSDGGTADWYFYLASARSATIRMNATGTTLDPFLELYNPSGGEVAIDDDSGGGFNAAIVNRSLTQIGWYKIRAKAVGVSNGGYTLALTLS